MITMNKFVLFVIFAVLHTQALAPLPSPTPEHLGPEHGDKFEGDMILTEEQMRVINDVNGVMDPKYLWPDKRFVYELDRNITNNETLIIKKAMDKIEEVSCVSFVKRTTEEDYVAITVSKETHYAAVGRQGGRQPLNVNYVGDGWMTHQILHGLGIHHIHSAYDRDDYLTIHWGNITKHGQVHYKKYANTMLSHLGARYDYLSIMHIEPHFKSDSFKRTFDPKFPVEGLIGQRHNMSSTDIFKVNELYDCN